MCLGSEKFTKAQKRVFIALLVKLPPCKRMRARKDPFGRSYVTSRIARKSRSTESCLGISINSLANDEVYHQYQDRGVVEKRENLMPKDCSAHQRVGYVHIGDGKARTDRVGEVHLVRTLLAGKGKRSGRSFRSIVQVSVVECVGGMKHSPRRDHAQSGHESQRCASHSLQVAYVGYQANC